MSKAMAKSSVKSTLLWMRQQHEGAHYKSSGQQLLHSTAYTLQHPQPLNESKMRHPAIRGRPAPAAAGCPASGRG